MPDDVAISLATQSVPTNLASPEEFPQGNLTYSILTEDLAAGVGTVMVLSADTSISTVVDIPETVVHKGVSYTSTHINAGAFYHVAVTSAKIPKSVTSIGNTAFLVGGTLTSLVVDEENQHYSTVDNILYNKNKTILLTGAGGKGGLSQISQILLPVLRQVHLGICHT